MYGLMGDVMPCPHVLPGGDTCVGMITELGHSDGGSECQ